MTDAEVRLRALTPADGPFLWEMEREAKSWRLAPDAPRPSLEDVVADPEVALYVEGWGRPGDGGVVAEAGHTPLGACWLRLFTAACHGWGFVSPDVPELSIAVIPSGRGRGIGTRLLDAAIAQARERGYPGVSLDVMKENPARTLYERAGFRRVAGDEDAVAWTMLLTLGGDQSGAPHQPFGT